MFHFLGYFGAFPLFFFFFFEIEISKKGWGGRGKRGREKRRKRNPLLCGVFRFCNGILPEKKTMNKENQKEIAKKKLPRDNAQPCKILHTCAHQVLPTPLQRTKKKKKKKKKKIVNNTK